MLWLNYNTLIGLKNPFKFKTANLFVKKPSFCLFKNGGTKCQTCHWKRKVQGSSWLSECEVKVEWPNSSCPHELQHWLTTTLINISSAIASKLEHWTRKYKSWSRTYQKQTCSRRLAGSEEPRLSLGRENLLVALLFHHLSLPALSHLSPGSSQPLWGRTGSVHLPWTWRRCRIHSTKALCSNSGSRH